jgi:hypothetical protein
MGDVLHAIQQQAAKLVTTHSPFGLKRRGVFHLRPVLCVSVQYLEWRDGGYLREVCCKGVDRARYVKYASRHLLVRGP